MAAPDSTKLQVNFKLIDGTLINVYAGDQAELESLLTTIQDTASLVQSVSQSLGNTVRSSAVSAPQQGLAEILSTHDWLPQENILTVGAAAALGAMVNTED